MSNRIKQDLVIKAFDMAYYQRQPASDLIFHSDRGSQYCSNEFRKLLENKKVLQSMGSKGDCFDNAVAESFFHTLKVEELHNLIFLTRKSAEFASLNILSYFIIEVDSILI